MADADSEFRKLLRDLRWLLTTPGLFGVAGVMAVTVGLLPAWVLPIPWWARLVIGAAGVVVVALTAPAAWRWMREGDREGSDGD